MKVFSKLPKILPGTNQQLTFLLYNQPLWVVFDVIAFWHISKTSCACSQLINQKKKLRASTGVHDPFFDEPKIGPSFIFSRVMPVHTFAKLPVHALINVLKKLAQKKLIV